MSDYETECNCEDVKCEMHSCPYAEACDCCPACERECADGI